MDMGDILNLTLPNNDAKAPNVRAFLKALLKTIWVEEDRFSGKRPFGSSSWDSELFEPLIRARVVTGSFDQDGYIQELDRPDAEAAIASAIDALGASK